MKFINKALAAVGPVLVCTLALSAATMSGFGPLATPAAANGVVVIANPSLEIAELEQSELARIFLGKRTRWDSGARIFPCMLNEKSNHTKSFLKDNLRKTVRQYRAYWKRRLFSGQGTAPKTFDTDGQVLDYVASNPGAIGVVSADTGDSRVKKISVQ